jgi:hypothetical protein
MILLQPFVPPVKIRDRKAGNPTSYPLSAVVGAAVIDYLKNARPATTCREVFMRTAARTALDMVTGDSIHRIRESRHACHSFQG